MPVVVMPEFCLLLFWDLPYALANEEVRRSFDAGVVVLKLELKFSASMAAVIALQQIQDHMRIKMLRAMRACGGSWCAWRLKNPQKAR
jgi:hypothetical protein